MEIASVTLSSHWHAPPCARDVISIFIRPFRPVAGLSCRSRRNPIRDVPGTTLIPDRRPSPRANLRDDVGDYVHAYGVTQIARRRCPRVYNTLFVSLRAIFQNLESRIVNRRRLSRAKIDCVIIANGISPVFVARRVWYDLRGCYAWKIFYFLW